MTCLRSAQVPRLLTAQLPGSAVVLALPLRAQPSHGSRPMLEPDTESESKRVREFRDERFRVRK